jgi:hypothetical protein
MGIFDYIKKKRLEKKTESMIFLVLEFVSFFSIDVYTKAGIRLEEVIYNDMSKINLIIEPAFLGMFFIVMTDIDRGNPEQHKYFTSTMVKFLIKFVKYCEPKAEVFKDQESLEAFMHYIMKTGEDRGIEYGRILCEGNEKGNLIFNIAKKFTTHLFYKPISNNSYKTLTVMTVQQLTLYIEKCRKQLKYK